MEKQIHILLFYKYIEIENPEEFKRNHLNSCNNIGIKGRIIVAGEGINGSVSGTKTQIEDYKKLLKQDERFSDIQFKEDLSLEHPFNKMAIKLKQQLIPFPHKVDLNKKGKYLSPKEFLEIYNKKEDVIILDARNNYESKVGKFKDAITPDIDSFRDFPSVLQQLKDKKDKKIVMYCTGGIRCEKASAYLINQGFQDVSQLKGGILEFGRQFPDTVWEGKCFVFDKRLLSSINKNDLDIANCKLCSNKYDFYRDCKNTKCNKFAPLCTNCYKEMNGCCSPACSEIYKEIIKEREIKNRNKSKQLSQVR